MTKAQAREYATRIRLGEPLWWVGDTQTMEACCAFLGDLSGGVLVASGRRGANEAWVWRPPGPTDSLPPPTAYGPVVQVAHVTITLQPVLRMLDQIANAP
jgi:hypothetical protein